MTRRAFKALWQRRYSEDGTHAYCPECETERVVQALPDEAAAAVLVVHRRAGTHIHPTAGTIFHKSSTSLHLWFYAMYLMASTRCGISAKQMERELGVTYKTAWRMAKLIRHELMTQDDDEPLLSGTVEADETYVGGTRRGDPPGRPTPADAQGRLCSAWSSVAGGCAP